MGKNNKQAKKMANHPKVKGYTEKFAKDIAEMLTEQFEKAKEEAQKNGGEFKFDMNGEMKGILESKGKEMGAFVKNMVNQENKRETTRAAMRNHAVKVNIR
ncbi:hypothetical protein D3C81_496860 [compost metagenome]